MGAEFENLSTEDMFRLWNLSQKSFDQLKESAAAKFEAIKEIAAADTKAIIEGVAADTETRKRLKETIEPSEKERLLEALARKRKELASVAAAVRERAAEKLAADLRKAETSERQRLKAKLVDPKDGSSLTSASSPLPPRYYVIVGRGTAAILNHTTLRQTSFGQDRLKDPADDTGKTQLPVIHIGMPDPWYYYHPHGMGQPPHLLVLPGYHYRPGWQDRTIRSGMNSWDFSFKNLQEWALLKMKYNFGHLEGWVAIIQKKGNESIGWAGDEKPWKEIPLTLKGEIQKASKIDFAVNAAYRLIVVLPNESITLVYAEKIDLCPGLPRPTVRPGVAQEDLTGLFAPARSQLWSPPDQWSKTIKERQILTGPEALNSMTPWEPSHRVYVGGGGGIGLNQVERAEDEGCTLDWLPRGTLHDGFNLPRNDTVLKDPASGKCREPGTSGLRDDLGALRPPKDLATLDLYPGNPKWRFGRYVTVDYDSVVLGGDLLLKIPVVDAAGVGEIHDHFEQSSKLENSAFKYSDLYKQKHPAFDHQHGFDGKYNRLIFCMGQAGGTLGSAQCITKGLRFELYPKDGIAVAFESDGTGKDAKLRILGASLATHEDYPVRLAATSDGVTGDYFKTLPLSAVPPGFIFNGVTIAKANGYFDDAKKNPNANTATREEMVAFLKDKKVPEDLALLVARAIENQRRPNNGFVDCFEALDILRKKKDEVVQKPGWDQAVLKLNFTYPEGGKLLP